jgi:dTDP-4-amino-4,6-dideoxygalactose transaminase
LRSRASEARGDTFAIGELSDAVCLSFIIQKNLGCFGDGGAVATNNKDLAAEIRKLRNHGSMKRFSPQHWLQQPPGRYPRSGLARKAEAGGRMERAPPRDCRIV